jgi:hypothetical protein
LVCERLVQTSFLQTNSNGHGEGPYVKKLD